MFVQIDVHKLIYLYMQALIFSGFSVWVRGIILYIVFKKNTGEIQLFPSQPGLDLLFLESFHL